MKSSDRSEITQAYEAAMPYVVQDWANWLLSKPRAARLPLIEKIAKHHGEAVGEMVKEGKIDGVKPDATFVMLDDDFV